MPQYIKKIRAPVRVTHPGEAPVEGSLWLAPQAEFHEGPETLLERLNGPERVVPFLRRKDESVLLLTRLELETVTPGDGIVPALVCPRTCLGTREERVVVRFRDGRSVEGIVRMELPDSLNRVSDFLNGEEDFFPLHTAGGVLLVNKNRIREALVFQSSPLPLGHRFRRRVPAL